MNKNIYIIFFILIWFVLNIFFYIFSSNYRYFLQSLKYDEVKDYKIDDQFKISIWDLDNKIENKNPEIDKENSIFAWLSNNFWEDNVKHTNDTNTKKQDTKKNNNINIKTNTDKSINEEKKVEYIDTREDIKLTNVEKNILDSLKKYKLKKIDLHPRLFDLTWEYPDKYFEYYNEDINLYFFGNKLYSDMKDIFEVLTYELPFSINEVNNFWSKSFYINLNSWFEDSYVRVVLEKSNRIFWFKIKKDLYEKMKNNLGVIFHK